MVDLVCWPVARLEECSGGKKPLLVHQLSVSPSWEVDDRYKRLNHVVGDAKIHQSTSEESQRICIQIRS